MPRFYRPVGFGGLLASALAVAVGLNVLALVNLAAGRSPGTLERLARIASWLPGTRPFHIFLASEILALAGWLLSWVLLSRWLGKRGIRGFRLVAVFVLGMVVATLLLWPPTVSLLWTM